MDHPFPLPPDLPRPADDGACDHLAGMKRPPIRLPSTGGRMVDVAALPARTVIYCYPMTGIPGVALPEGWDLIPGARGCTPETCAFRDHADEIADPRRRRIRAQYAMFRSAARDGAASAFALRSAERRGPRVCGGAALADLRGRGPQAHQAPDADHQRPDDRACLLPGVSAGSERRRGRAMAAKRGEKALNGLDGNYHERCSDLDDPIGRQR